MWLIRKGMHHHSLFATRHSMLAITGGR